MTNGESHLVKNTLHVKINSLRVLARVSDCACVIWEKKKNNNKKKKSIFALIQGREKQDCTVDGNRLLSTKLKLYFLIVCLLFLDGVLQHFFLAV